MSDDTNIGVLERPRQHRENRKKNIGRKVADNQAQAVAKFIRVPPRKARLVIDEVRGKYAYDALAFLRFIPNRAAHYISKVLTSAVANAANNHGLNPDNLKLVECRVDEGPRMKRVQPRAQGRAYRILKRMSHITVIVEEVDPKPRKPKKAAVRRNQPGRQSQAAVAAPAPILEEPIGMVADTAAPIANEATVSAETPTANVTSAPQTADTDTTDEIGAPVTPPASEPVVESAAASPAPIHASGEGETPVRDATTAHTATGGTEVETANTHDKTDEIGAPTE